MLISFIPSHSDAGSLLLPHHSFEIYFPGSIKQRIFRFGDSIEHEWASYQRVKRLTLYYKHMWNASGFFLHLYTRILAIKLLPQIQQLIIPKEEMQIYQNWEFTSKWSIKITVNSQSNKKSCYVKNENVHIRHFIFIKSLQ